MQSRYYDPDLGRFISADDFDCLTTSNFFSANAYAYCWNSPIAFKDSEGNTPNLALAYANIKAFLVDVNGKIAEKLEAKKQKFLEKLQERVENLKAKFDEAKEKAKYYLKNPDVLASKIASRIAGHEVTVRFPLLELIRGMTKLVETVVDKSENSNISSAKRDAKKNDDKEKSDSRKSFESILQTIFQSLVAVIELDVIDRGLKAIGSSLEKISKHAFNAVTEVFGAILAFGNTALSYLKENALLDLLDLGNSKLVDAGLKTDTAKELLDVAHLGELGGIFTEIIKFTSSTDDIGKGSLSHTQDLMLLVANLCVGIAAAFIPSPIVSSIVSGLFDIVSRSVVLRINGMILG